MKIVNVQGRKKTGKTTTVTNIIAELCRRGYSVGSVKGIHIDGFTMDVEGEDTGKHKKAGANPVTARCHDETNIMFKDKMNLREILRHYDNDWVVIESHVDLHCPNIITGRTAEYDGDGKDVSLAEQINELSIACSGVISNEISEFRGLPVINSNTAIEELVNIIEASYERAGHTKAEILEPAKPFDLIETNSFTKVYADSEEQTDGEADTDSMLTENTVEIYVDKQSVGSVPCTPEYIAELVLGWCNDEAYINGIEDFSCLEISEDGSRADLSIGKKFTELDSALSDCATLKAGATLRPYNTLKPVAPIEWEKEWILELAEDFEIILPLREKTMAAHNCRLARPRSDGSLEILFKCEDIGRHSAIDKAVGWALRNEIDLRDCVLFTSGRISRAMAHKVIRAGIPLMAGKGTISKKAVELAKENKLTIIGYAKKDSFCIFA